MVDLHRDLTVEDDGSKRGKEMKRGQSMTKDRTLNGGVVMIFSTKKTNGNKN